MNFEIQKNVALSVQKYIKSVTKPIRKREKLPRCQK